MPSLIDKIDTLGHAKRGQKSLGNNLYGYTGAYIPSGDLSRDDWGAAAAYAVIVEVYAALAVWETNLDGVTWIVKDRKTGQEVARTDVQDYPLNERGGKWYKAIKDFEKRYYHSYFKSLAFSDWLFGETYVALLAADKQYRPNSTNYAGIQWLNPLNVEPITMRGYIDYYQYSGMDTEGKYQFMPDEMAYRMNRRNPFDDLRGYSGVLAAMDAINLSRNSLKAFKNYFSQGMQLGGVIMPDGEGNLSNVEHESARREWAENHKGTANSGRWAILRKRMSVVPFGQEDVSNNFQVTKDLKNMIFTALSVPPQLAGDPSDATYDNAEDIKRQWFQTFFIPYVKDIAGFNSSVLIPKLEPDSGVYIEADLSPYEVEKPDVISQDMNAGYIDMATAQGKRGYTVDEDLRGVYLINNIPMSKDVILKLSKTIPAQYALDYANAQATGQTPNLNADMASGVIKPPSADEQVDNADATESGGFEYRNGVAIPQKEVFGYHIDAGIVDINEARAQLGLPPKAKEEANELQDLQAKLSIMNSAVAAGISTLGAAQMVGLVLPAEAALVTPVQEQQFRAWLKSVKPAPVADEIIRNYLTETKDEPLVTHKLDPITGKMKAVEVVDPAEQKAHDSKILNEAIHTNLVPHDHSHDQLPAIVAHDADELEELAAWRKFITNGKAHKRDFEQKALRGDIGDLIQSAVESRDKQNILSAFHQAQERIEARVKAISATRLDFENDFDELLKRARAEKMGRVQWATAMRSIIRRYGQRAYVDGLLAGGVEDDPDEDDQITINELHNQNSAYVTELGNTLYKGDGISDAQADIKAGMWFNKSINPYFQEGLLSANGNGLYEWYRKNGKDSCASCIRLEGQRHRLKDWHKNGLLPKSSRLDCKGFECECQFIPAKGRQRGNY